MNSTAVCERETRWQYRTYLSQYMAEGGEDIDGWLQSWNQHLLHHFAYTHLVAQEKTLATEGNRVRVYLSEILKTDSGIAEVSQTALQEHQITPFTLHSPHTHILYL